MVTDAYTGGFLGIFHDETEVKHVNIFSI